MFNGKPMIITHDVAFPKVTFLFVSLIHIISSGICKHPARFPCITTKLKLYTYGFTLSLLAVFESALTKLNISTNWPTKPQTSLFPVPLTAGVLESARKVSSRFVPFEQLRRLRYLFLLWTLSYNE